MSRLKSKKLLVTAARARQEKVEKISKKEIQHKIDEIKYLSSQKKVPKLTLRKEIIHLENKLEGVFEIEKKLLKAERSESVKIGSLKKQISLLKQRLEHAQDDDLRKKVSKLTHLLGDTLAKSQSKQDVKLSEEILSVMQEVEIKKKTVEDNNKKVVQRINMILKRVEILEHEIEINKKLGKGDPKTLEQVGQSLLLLQKKLEEYKQKHPDLFKELEEARKAKGEAEVKHSMLFSAEDEAEGKDNETNVSEPSSEGASKGELAALPQPKTMTPAEHFAQQHIEVVDEKALEEELTEELPLPPPPKIGRKKK